MFRLKKAVRTIQTYFPDFVDMKYRVQYLSRQLTRLPFERDFKVLEKFYPSQFSDFLDIGANRGQTVQAMRLYKSENPIICFEPSQKTYQKLKYHTKNVRGVEVRNIGIGENSARVKLYTPVYRGYVFDGLASTVEDEARDWLNEKTILFFNKKHLRILEEVIDIQKLDSQGSNPAFIKVDVQGSELSVLKGGERTIAEHRPVFLIEAEEREREAAFLSRFGYRSYGFDGKALRCGVMSGSNVFFIPSQRLNEFDISILH